MVLDKARLEEIFSRSFRDAGSDYFACCPVHEEKTPSFYIGKENHLVHCFGCGAKGHLVDFIQDYKGVDAADARVLLGITPEDEVDSWFHAILPVRTEPRIYPESWLSPYKKEIHKYVSRRGFSSSTLREAGALYDHNRQRQVFPHRRRDGKLVGAIGRACRGQEPKWYYYWGYEKGRYLYTPRYAQSRSGRLDDQPRQVYIVEGVFDALWCQQHGLHAAAILGSKASKDQIAEIVWGYESVVLALDNDDAGLAGSIHLYDKLRGRVEVLFPYWPAWGIDVMNVNPSMFELYNVIQRELISTSSSSSRVLSQ